MSKQKTFCQLIEEDFIEKDFKEYKNLIRNGRYVCRSCGRVARKKKYLSNPVVL